MVLNFLLSLFTSVAMAQAEPVRIAVLDTGFGATVISRQTKKLCKYGHKDFTGTNQFWKSPNTVDPIPVDTHGHGTNIVGLLTNYADLSGVNYCIVIVKVFAAKKNDKKDVSARGFEYIRNLRIPLANFSGGGEESYEAENIAVKAYVKDGYTLVAAAGNEMSDLAKTPYYPACIDDKIIVVGNVSSNGIRALTSNFGKRVSRWEVGVNQEGFGITLTGTSQATAVATGKILGEKYGNSDRREASK